MHHATIIFDEHTHKKRFRIDVNKYKNIKDALISKKINPTTVLAKKNGYMISLMSPIRKGETIEIVKIISGG